MNKFYSGILGLILITLAIGVYLKMTPIHDERGILRNNVGYIHINDIKQINNFYPLTVSEVKARSEYIQIVIPQELQRYLQQDPSKISKQKALYSLDAFSNYYDIIGGQLYLISMVHPDKEIATAAKEEVEKLEKLSIDLFSMNRDLYLFLKRYNEEGLDRQKLSEPEVYFLEESLKSYERNGLNLSEDARNEIGALKKELAELEMQFNMTIAQDNRVVEVTDQELEGLPEDFIATLSKTEDGNFILKSDYPTQEMVMTNCKVSDTRKKFYQAMNDKAYPANESTLKSVIAKRHQLAQLLGFKSFAHYDLSNQMAKSPEVIWDLFKNLEPHMKSKAITEKNMFCSDLPESVRLTLDGKINPWDWSYLVKQYIKKHYQYDDLVMAQYFPLRETIAGLFNIYEQFFSITLKEVTLEKSWHEDVFVIEVSRDKQVVGYIFVDLHPRDNKYGHAAVFSGVNTHRSLDGTLYPGVCALVCNFTKATDTKPALLTYNEVNTFFHEFGHALHDVLGTTALLSQSGTHVKRDFVELPSQILEFWLEDRDILRSLGRHYQTGESLPEDLIDKKLQLDTISNGYFESRQAVLAQVALALFERSEHTDIYQVYYNFLEDFLPFIDQQEKYHFLCNFGHLCGYGAKYYGYLWTRIFACDVFEQIEKEGLLNPQAGNKYLDAILSKGGSKDPNELLYDYLGRKPSQEAFLKRNKFI